MDLQDLSPPYHSENFYLTFVSSFISQIAMNHFHQTLAIQLPMLLPPTHPALSKHTFALHFPTSYLTVTLPMNTPANSPKFIERIASPLPG